jgi:IS1 family transposase
MNSEYNTSLVNNIKNKSISKTIFSKHMYSNLWYTDDTNKICITFSPRGGCSISFKQYLDLVGLLNDGEKYNSFIHHYRMDLFVKNIKNVPIDYLIKENYTFIKFIINPYIRAVSIYRLQTHNLSFRNYLQKLVNKEIIFTNSENYHLQEQYIDGEEKIVTKYIKIDENEKYNIILRDNTSYELDVNKYTSPHHGKKIDNTDFCGDTPRIEINKKLPNNYKFFYDEEIKNLVDTFYKNDVEKYGFKFLI